MRNRIVLVCLTTLVPFVTLEAKATSRDPKGLHDVVVPVLPGDPSTTDREVGQLYFDASSGVFKGIDTTGEAIELGSSADAPTVVSGGAERVERAHIDNTGSGCSVTSQSGVWLGSCTRNGTGDITINIIAGKFSGTPMCFCQVNNNAWPRVCSVLGTPSTTSYQFATQGGGGVFTTAVDLDFNVICMGPR